MNWLTFVAIVLLVVACTPQPPAPQSPIIDASGAATDYPDDDPVGVRAGDKCALAARVLWGCHCRESGKSDGSTFPNFCREHGAAIATDCIVAAKQCSDLPSCMIRCLP